MSNAAHTNAAPRWNRDAPAPPRRALIFATSPAGESLSAQLAGAGYEVRAIRTEGTSRAIAEFAPHVALIETGAGARGAAQLEFALRLRAERATSALPLVLLYERDDVSRRAAALSIGADDYFALATPPAELLARLDALFWRAEAGRRNAPLSALEQRAEIDDFLHLLDAVRADIEGGAKGTLSLITASAPQAVSHGAAQESRMLAEAQAFFRFNLRRADLISFYGPTLLLAYLPRKTARTAQLDLARLCDEFLEMQPGSSLSFGLASFPSDGTEIESLIERAEVALESSRPPPAAEDSSEELDAGHKPTVNPPLASSPLSKSVGPPSQAMTAEREARAAHSPSRAVRESRQGDSLVAPTLLAGEGGNAAREPGTLLARSAAAAAGERERRARGAIMPRRLLLTISDPARMAQVNLLLRSAGYEVRAAFDGLQAINLLRIERPDLLVIDDALYGIDGLEALRRLHKQHHDRLPLPVVLLLSNAAERERVRAEAQALGAHGFVPMPYDPEELLNCVRTVGSTD